MMPPTLTLPPLTPPTLTLEARIRTEIAALIHAGALKPGDRIANEHALAARHGCARATVSKALAGLARAGLITRRRRAGSFVAHPHMQTAVLAVPDLQKLITAQGLPYRWQRIRRRPATAAELAAAGLTAPALHVAGVHYGGAEAFALESRLIALASVPGAAAEPFASQPPGGWLLAHVPWTRARHGIRARAATPPEAQVLGIAPGAACLAITRQTWRVEAPVTHVCQLFPGGRYDLVAEFHPGGA